MDESTDHHDAAGAGAIAGGAGGVVIGIESMYYLLLKIDGRLTALASVSSAEAATLRDHETRLREIEAREDVTRRLAELVDDHKLTKEAVRSLQVRVYAIPSLATLVAIAALALTITRYTP